MRQRFPIEVASARGSNPSQWHAFVLIAACLSLVLVVFGQTFVEMARIWQRSETFSHGFLVLPVFFYLVWQRRAELAAAPILPVRPALVLIAAAGFIWLLGELSSSLTPSFFAMVSLVPLAVLGVLGWRWVKLLAFPFALLLFAVPFGEVFVPTLIELTADFTVAALRLSGVPVYREGANFVVPGGQWSVVDTCSGVRYLIASMFAGALYAWHMYRSPLRRSIFFAASIAVPIVANWVRAYLIVMLAYLSDNRVAVGIDHLFYGWVFFGLVMFGLFAVGAIWREDHVQAIEQASAPTQVAQARLNARWQQIASASALTCAALLAWPLLASALTRPHVERSLSSPSIEPTAGWLQAGELTTWQPQLDGAARESRFSFEKEGQRVGVFLGFYRNQRQGAELVNSTNKLVRDDNPRWRSVAAGTRSVNLNGRPLVLRMEQLRGVEGTIVAWSWYWLGGASTASDSRAKFDLALDRLLLRGDTSAWVTIYTVGVEDVSRADQVLDAFINDMGRSLDHALRKVASE